MSTGCCSTTLDGLVERTREVLADDALRARLATSAEARARRYGLEAFGERLEALVAGVLGP